jgi:uncharacterized protein
MAELENPTLVVISAMAALGFMIGLSKSGLTGMGALVTPILSLAMPTVVLAVGVSLPMLIVGDAFAIYAYRGEWDWKLVRRLLPGALLGVLAGTLLLTNLPTRALQLGLALFTLVVVAYRFVGDVIRQLRYRPQPWHGPAAGTLTGIASALFNVGGPPFNAYMLLQKLPPRTFVATTAIFFGMLNLMKVPGFLMAGVIDLPLLTSMWWVFVFIPLGSLAGRELIKHIDHRMFEAVIVLLLLLTSALLIWQSV